MCPIVFSMVLQSFDSKAMSTQWLAQCWIHRRINHVTLQQHCFSHSKNVFPSYSQGPDKPDSWSVDGNFVSGLRDPRSLHWGSNNSSNSHPAYTACRSSVGQGLRAKVDWGEGSYHRKNGNDKRGKKRFTSLNKLNDRWSLKVILQYFVSLLGNTVECETLQKSWHLWWS